MSLLTAAGNYRQQQ